jgi:transposase-like protein
VIQIDERVGEFLNRPLTGEWPYVWLDATYLKVRQGGRIVPVAAMIAVAANTERRRKNTGLSIGPSEAETFSTEFLRSLRTRGLGGVRLVISDAHTGLKAAIARVFEATWQRCRVHWMRNALAVRHWARTNGASMAYSRAASTLSSPPRSARLSNSLTAKCERNLAQGRRTTAPALAQAGRSHGRKRACRAGLHVLPAPPPRLP